MRFRCEKCNKGYEIPDKLIEEKRLKIRCKACDNINTVGGKFLLNVAQQKESETLTWHFRRGKNVIGPLSTEAMITRIKTGMLLPKNLVTNSKSDVWLPLKQSSLASNLEDLMSVKTGKETLENGHKGSPSLEEQRDSGCLKKDKLSGKNSEFQSEIAAGELVECCPNCQNPLSEDLKECSECGLLIKVNSKPRLFTGLLRFVIFILIIIISALILSYIFQKVKEVKKTQTVSQPNYVTVETKLNREFKKNKYSADKKYKGEVIQVTGMVSDVDRDRKGLFVELEETKLQCYLSSYADAASISKYQRITINGVYSHYNYGVIMESCIPVTNEEPFVDCDSFDDCMLKCPEGTRQERYQSMFNFNESSVYCTNLKSVSFYNKDKRGPVIRYANLPEKEWYLRGYIENFKFCGDLQCRALSTDNLHEVFRCKNLLVGIGGCKKTNFGWTCPPCKSNY